MYQVNKRKKILKLREKECSLTVTQYIHKEYEGKNIFKKGNIQRKFYLYMPYIIYTLVVNRGALNIKEWSQLYFN